MAKQLKAADAAKDDFLINLITHGSVRLDLQVHDLQGLIRTALDTCASDSDPGNMRGRGPYHSLMGNASFSVMARRGRR